MTTEPGGADRGRADAREVDPAGVAVALVSAAIIGYSTALAIGILGVFFPWRAAVGGGLFVAVCVVVSSQLLARRTGHRMLLETVTREKE